MSSTSDFLIRPNGVSEYQISYADNGNIITKTDVGDYQDSIKQIPIRYADFCLDVNGQGGGGWEILYNGYIDLKVVKIVVTPLP